MDKTPKNYTSIWVEHSEVYNVTKTIFSSIITVLYPLGFFCVLKKSPKNFGFLKWFLVFHMICISIAWIANCLLIDYFYFSSSLVARIDGLMTIWMDSYTLYLISYVIYGCSLASSQLIFCNRVFLIMNMYKGVRTMRQNILEFSVYINVGLMPLCSIPVVYLLTPDQAKSKKAIIQAFTVFVFANFPILVANLILLVDIEIAWPSYIIDVLRENQPNASLLTLFLFYDPYQLYLKTIWKNYQSRFSTRTMRVKSAYQSSQIRF